MQAGMRRWPNVTRLRGRDTGCPGTTSDRATTAPARPVAAILEILAMTSLLLSYIWVWQGTFRGDFLLCVSLYFGIGLAGQVRRGESVADIGFRLDNWRPALRDALRVASLLIAASLAAGAALGSLCFPSPGKSAIMLLGGWAWGTAQQYGLLCFYYRRLVELLPDERRATGAAAFLFALFHLPNPFLTPFTLMAGILCCWLYRREPNVPVLGAMHSVVSFVNLHALPASITFHHHVGPGFFG